MRRISARMGNSENNYWLALSPQDVAIVMITKHPVHIPVFEVVTSDGNIMPPFTILHGLRFNMKEIGCWKTLRLQQDSTPCHTSKRTQKISVTISLLTPGNLNPKVAISLIIMCGVQLTKRPTKLCDTSDELKGKIIAAFTNSNKEKEILAGYSKVVRKLWMKPMTISLCKLYL